MSQFDHKMVSIPKEDWEKARKILEGIEVYGREWAGDAKEIMGLLKMETLT